MQRFVLTRFGHLAKSAASTSNYHSAAMHFQILQQSVPRALRCGPKVLYRSWALHGKPSARMQKRLQTNSRIFLEADLPGCLSRSLSLLACVRYPPHEKKKE